MGYRVPGGYMSDTMGFIPDPPGSGSSSPADNTTIDNRLRAMGIDPAMVTPEFGQSILNGPNDVGLQQGIMEKLGLRPEQVFSSPDVLSQYYNKLAGGTTPYTAGPGAFGGGGNTAPAQFGGNVPMGSIQDWLQQLFRQPQSPQTGQAQGDPPPMFSSFSPPGTPRLSQQSQQYTPPTMPQGGKPGGLMNPQLQGQPAMPQYNWGQGGNIASGGRSLMGGQQPFQFPQSGPTPGIMNTARASTMPAQQTTRSTGQLAPRPGAVNDGSGSFTLPGMGDTRYAVRGQGITAGTEEQMPTDQPVAGGNPGFPLQSQSTQPTNQQGQPNPYFDPTWAPTYGIDTGGPGGGMAAQQLPDGISRWLTNNYLSRGAAPEVAGMLTSFFQNQGFTPQVTPFDNGAGQMQYAQNVYNQGTQPAVDWARALFQQGLPGANAQYNQSGFDQLGANVLQGGRGVYGAQDAYSQILNQGLAGQGDITSLIPSQLQLGQQQQQSAAQIMNNIYNGQGMFTPQLQQMGNQLFQQMGYLPMGQNPIQAPNYQGPNNLFNQIQQQASNVRAPQVQAPDFYNSLLGRAFGAGQGLQSAQAQAALLQAPSMVQGAQTSLPGQAQAGPIQDTVASSLQSRIQGGGLDDQLVQAMRERILKPANDALRGRLNQQGGGQADPGSPLFQELQRRQEADFNNDLLIQGFGNLNQLLGQGAAMGGQQFGQGLQNQQLNQAGQQFNAAQAQQAALANQQAQMQTGQFNLQGQNQMALANQAAQQQTQALGVNAGLQGLGLIPQVGSQMLGAQQANQGAALQSQGMSLDALQALAGQLSQSGQFGANQQLQTALANQQNAFNTNQFNTNYLGQQQDRFAGLQAQMQQQYLQNANLMNQFGQGGINNALNAFQGAGGLGLQAIGSAAQQGNVMAQLGLDRFNSANSLGLQAGNLGNQIGQQQGQFAASMINPMLQGQNQTWNAQNSQVNNMLQYLADQGKITLGQAGLATDLATTQMGINSAADIARITGLAGGVQALIPWLAGLFPGGATGQPTGGNQGGIAWPTGPIGSGGGAGTPPFFPPAR